MLLLFGRRYRLCFRSPLRYQGRLVRGLCDPPDARNKAIYVDSRLTGEARLEVLIHEILHACDWYRDEEWVGPVARDAARALWRLGYRGPDDG